MIVEPEIAKVTNTEFDGAFCVGAWIVLAEANRIERGNCSNRVSPLAMDVLGHLISRAGRSVSHTELLHAFWRGVLSSTNGVHKCIAELWRAFGDDPRAPSYIETIPKRGYRLIAPVRQLEERQQPTDASTLESRPRPLLGAEFKRASIN